MSEHSLWYDGTRHVRPIRNFRYTTFVTFRIEFESGRPIRIRIESGSLAGPYQNLTFFYASHTYKLQPKLHEICQQPKQTMEKAQPPSRRYYPIATQSRHELTR